MVDTPWTPQRVSLIIQETICALCYLDVSQHTLLARVLRRQADEHADHELETFNAQLRRFL